MMATRITVAATLASLAATLPCRGLPHQLHWFGHVQPVWERYDSAIKSTARFNNQGPAQAGPFFNLNCAGSDSSCLASAIAADAWLCQHPVRSNVKANSAAWAQTLPTARSDQVLRELPAYRTLTQRLTP